MKIELYTQNPLVKKWNLANNLEDYKYSSATNYTLGKGCCDIDISV